MKKYLLLIVAIFTLGSDYAQSEEPVFAIIIPSYNNKLYVYRNLTRALHQDYSHYHIYYINDASTDGTLQAVQDLVAKEGAEDLISIIDNPTRRGALANIYHTIHNMIPDDEIVVLLDGDDWFAHERVLSKLKEQYTREDREIWLTYGQFRRTDGNKRFRCIPYPKNVIRNSSFRTFRTVPSHLRTFQSWLFKQIREEDLKHKGEFFKMSWDLAFMIPMLEMAVDHFQFIQEILYVYNDHNPLSDFRVDRDLQIELESIVRLKDPYDKLLMRP